MAGKESLKGNCVKTYLRRFPDTPTLTIARKIYKENLELFTSLESARKTVRYYRGQTGDDGRAKVSTKEFLRPITNNTNPFRLPESFASVRQDYILPKSATNILMLSDIHVPYQNNEAITLCLNLGKEKNINTIYLNSDIIDMYQASFHEKDPRNRSIKDELEMTRELLASIRNAFPKAYIYYKEGNHSARLRRYLMVKAPELLDCTEFELPTLLRFNEFKIHWIPNKQAVKIGKLYVLHGNEFKGGGGTSPARAYYTKSKVSIIAGDKHQTSEHTEPSLDGSTITCWSTGCLCELNPDYMPFNKWNLGAALINVEEDGDFSVHNFRIVKGKNGKLKIV
mgnify:CR=1 FL=1